MGWERTLHKKLGLPSDQIPGLDMIKENMKGRMLLYLYLDLLTVCKMSVELAWFYTSLEDPSIMFLAKPSNETWRYRSSESVSVCKVSSFVSFPPRTNERLGTPTCRYSRCASSRCVRRPFERCSAAAVDARGTRQIAREQREARRSPGKPGRGERHVELGEFRVRHGKRTRMGR